MLHQTPNPTKILDCTFRDGGYYTNWTFADDVVDGYVDTVNALPLGMVELGLVGKPADKGPFARVTDAKFRDLATAIRADKCVMMDAKDALTASEPLTDAVARLLKGVTPEMAGTVRIAAHFGQAKDCIDLSRAIADHGFRVFLNLMQIDAASFDAVNGCIDSVQQNDAIDALYLADSFGSMTPSRTRQLISVFVGGLNIEVGFHGHDNRGLAALNAEAAVQAGATWIDGTMSGMGRGAGNAATEQIAPLLTKLSGAQEQMLLSYVGQHFTPMKQHHRWGSSAAYQFAGSNKIHPTFVQKLLESGALSDSAVIERLTRIPAAFHASFSDVHFNNLVTKEVA